MSAQVVSPIKTLFITSSLTEPGKARIKKGIERCSSPILNLFKCAEGRIFPKRSE